jgi:uncharacterized damage-inducible protein DinB
MIAEQHEALRISDQLRRSYEGHAWHGPSVKEALEGVTAEIAARRPAIGAHTIWQMVRHIAFWASVARKTLEGQPYPPRLNAPADWPEPAGSWPDALTELEFEQKSLIVAAARMRDDQLREIVTQPKGYTNYLMLHGVVQHNIYHAGQIVLLKK